MIRALPRQVAELLAGYRVDPTRGFGDRRPRPPPEGPSIFIERRDPKALLSERSQFDGERIKRIPYLSPIS